MLMKCSHMDFDWLANCKDFPSIFSSLEQTSVSVCDVILAAVMLLLGSQVRFLSGESVRKKIPSLTSFDFLFR